MPARLLLPLALLLVALPGRAWAFDYLEHSFFSDRACLEAQRRLAPLARTHADVAERYLALSLFCPEKWERPYCAGGYKQLEGSLNRLEEPPTESGDHPITLGDYAALPDHLTEWGPVRGMPRADQEGLTLRTFEWLDETGDARGVIADVAEDACETGDPVEWQRLERDVAAGLEELGQSEDALPLPVLLPTARGPIARGPHDPSGPYSFDNPQYLDLVLRNHHHFGVSSWATWTGFHTAAFAIASTPCEERLAFSASRLSSLSRGFPAFEEVRWKSLPDDELRSRGCALLAERVKRRAREWAVRADPALVEPVRPLLDALATGAPRPSLASAVMALVFEGVGLHFLQDSLAGGHLRVERAAYGLEDSRYMHDTDGRHGVSAELATRAGTRRFVAFGDSYLLGHAGTEADRCDWQALPAAAPDLVSACLLRRQRALVLASSTAALLDWALGGLLFEGRPDGCDEGDAARAFACAQLPTRAPLAAGHAAGGDAPRTLAPGTLPVPPPPFSYQSLLFSTSHDASGGPPQLGLRTVFLSQLGSRANWMTSYHVGLLTTLGRGERAQLVTEFSYMFHWRWAARFLINAGPFAFGGLRGLGEGVSPFAGVGPNVGASVLPEGWIRLPLEVSLSYRLPLTLLDARHGFSSKGIRIEAHWIELGLGLAFM